MQSGHHSLTSLKKENQARMDLNRRLDYSHFLPRLIERQIVFRGQIKMEAFSGIVPYVVQIKIKQKGHLAVSLTMLLL